MNNPWKGLSSYEEKDKNIYEFRGRTTAANELYLLLSNNLFCTLYGKMGCGKTSLLHAGIFPILRQKSFLPVTIRLNMSKQEDLTDFVIQAIEEECEKQSVCIKKNENWKYDNGIKQSKNYKLWEFLYSHIFVNDKEECVFPVIAIDQIEEAFKEKYAQACELLSQLYYLVSDDLRLPNNCYANFRVITIIREDDLYLLEDAIGDGGFNILKQNRYRLAPLTDNEAQEIIELGVSFFKEDEKERIMDKILSLSKEESSHVSTYMLSLICSQLFINSKGIITLNDIPESSTGLMQTFYESNIKHVSPGTKIYVENDLVKDDRRNIVPLKEFKNTVGTNDFDTLIDGESKMVQEITAGTTRCVELIHDSLAKAIKKYKDEQKEREEQEKQRQFLIEQQKEEKREMLRKYKMKRRRVTRIYMILAAILLGGIGYCINFLYDKAEEEKNNKIEAERQLGLRKITVTLKEDDAVKGLWWEATLKVTAKTNTKDTILIDSIINKTNLGSVFFSEIEADHIKSLLIDLNYPEHKSFHKEVIYVDKDSIIKEKPIVLPIRLNAPVYYGGRVVMSDSLTDYQIENAIVILGNDVAFTDGQGKFMFQLQEANDTTELIVIKKNYKQHLTNVFSGDFKQKEQTPESVIPMDLEDSTNFKRARIWCTKDVQFNKEEFRNNQKTDYQLLHSKISRIKYEGTRQSEDVIHLFLVFEGDKGGKMSIRGYYYYGDEKKYGYRCVIRGHSELLKDSEGLSYRSFEFTSLDIANNEETIKGKYYTSDPKKGLPWEFNIFIGTRKIAESIQ